MNQLGAGRVLVSSSSVAEDRCSSFLEFCFTDYIIVIISWTSLCLSVSQGRSFIYYPNPELFPLNREGPEVPYRFKPGGVIAVEVNRQLLQP